MSVDRIRAANTRRSSFSILAGALARSRLEENVPPQPAPLTDPFAILLDKLSALPKRSIILTHGVNMDFLRGEVSPDCWIGQTAKIFRYLGWAAYTPAFDDPYNPDINRWKRQHAQAVQIALEEHPNLPVTLAAYSFSGRSALEIAHDLPHGLKRGDISQMVLLCARKLNIPVHEMLSSIDPKLHQAYRRPLDGKVIAANVEDRDVVKGGGDGTVKGDNVEILSGQINARFQMVPGIGHMENFPTPILAQKAVEAITSRFVPSNL